MVAEFGVNTKVHSEKIVGLGAGGADSFANFTKSFDFVRAWKRLAVAGKVALDSL